MPPNREYGTFTLMIRLDVYMANNPLHVNIGPRHIV